MLCQCGSKSKVLDSRLQDDGGMWRKRKCLSCSNIFTTTELICVTLAAAKGRPIATDGVAKDRHATMTNKRVVAQQPKPMTRPKHVRSVPTKIPKNRKEVAVQTAASEAPRIIPARNRIEDMRMQNLLDEY